jgi:hypothetical protein
MFSVTKNIKNIRKTDRYGCQITPTCGREKPNAMLRTMINSAEYLLMRVLMCLRLPREVNIAFSEVIKV